MSTQQTDKILSEVFDVEPILEPEVLPPIVQNDTKAISQTGKDDFYYVRENLYELIEKGAQAASNALEVATESQHPRAYEVAGNLLKNVGDLADKLVALQKNREQMTGVATEAAKSQINVDKAVFVGSTAELLKIIKKESSNG